MAKKQPKVTKIRIEYDNGSIKEAVGEDANTIMDSWNSLQFMAQNHGQKYSGPFMKEVGKIKPQLIKEVSSKPRENERRLPY